MRNLRRRGALAQAVAHFRLKWITVAKWAHAAGGEIELAGGSPAMPKHVLGTEKGFAKTKMSMKTGPGPGK